MFPFLGLSQWKEPLISLQRFRPNYLAVFYETRYGRLATKILSNGPIFRAVFNETQLGRPNPTFCQENRVEASWTCFHWFQQYLTGFDGWVYIIPA
jgi:hypothetical protein